MKIPSEFLTREGFTVIRDYDCLNRLFDLHLDDQNKLMHLDSVDGVSIDEQFSPSEVLYRLARREYDRAFQQWSLQYEQLNDGSYLHKEDVAAAQDCWVIHCENNKPTEEE